MRLWVTFYRTLWNINPKQYFSYILHLIVHAHLIILPAAISWKMWAPSLKYAWSTHTLTAHYSFIYIPVFCVRILYSYWCLLWSFKSRYVFPLIFLHRLKRLVRFYTFTTPPGLTLGYQSLLPPSLTSCSRCESRVVWIRTRDQWWCTAAPASDALGHFVLWTPASYWFVQSSATEKS